MFKKILLPIDLQEISSWEHSLPVALGMAKDGKAELHLLTVVPPLPGQIYGYFPEDFEPKMVDEGKAAIESFAKEHAPGAHTKAHIAQGQPYAAILDLAEKIGADLIVMASHRPELKDYLLGPNAARVVRHAECSVMVVRR